MVQAAGPADHQDSPYIIVRQKSDDLDPLPLSFFREPRAEGSRTSQTQFCGQQEQLSHIPISARTIRCAALPSPNASEGFAMLA